MVTFKSNVDLALKRYWQPWSLPFAPSALECAIYNRTPYFANGYRYDPANEVLVSDYTPYVTAVTKDFRKRLFNLYCGLFPVKPTRKTGRGIINFSKIINSDYDFRLL